MNRIAYACLALASLVAAAPAHAVTNENGEVLISQAAVNAGGITPGDTAGFPVTISVPGSYRLTSSLTVTTAVNGIEVRANEVSIDMGGFTLAGSGVGRNGMTSFNRATRISHGNIRGFTNDGVRSIAPFLTVTDMIITANGRYGVDADPGLTHGAGFASVSGSKITANGAVGILCGDDCRVENSIASLNGYTGIAFYGTGGLALGNSIRNNGSNGIVFHGLGGAGNNTVVDNPIAIQAGFYIAMQPNACSPACPP